MYVMPPQRAEARPTGDRAGWTLIGPGFAAIIGLAMLTAVYRTDGKSAIRFEFHMSGQAVLLTCVVAYLVAAIAAAGLGLVLGARFPTAVTVPAIVLMLIGTALTALAASSAMLLPGRVLDGLGTGAAAGVIAALVLRLNARRGIAAAVTVALGVLAALIAPVVAQLISDATSFRLAYLAAIPFLLIALIVSAVSGIASTERHVHPAPYGTPYPSQGPAQFPNPAPYGMPYPSQGPPPQHPNPAPYGTPYPPQAPPP